MWTCEYTLSTCQTLILEQIDLKLIGPKDTVTEMETLYTYKYRDTLSD